MCRIFIPMIWNEKKKKTLSMAKKVALLFRFVDFFILSNELQKSFNFIALPLSHTRSSQHDCTILILFDVWLLNWT